VSGGKWASGARSSKGARACEGGQITRGRGRVHDEGRGREVRDGLTGGVCGTEREKGRARERNGADRLTPQNSERERGREEVCGSAPTRGPACQGSKARGRAWG
jgi:hypothetical protein